MRIVSKLRADSLSCVDLTNAVRRSNRWALDACFFS